MPPPAFTMSKYARMPAFSGSPVVAKIPVVAALLATMILSSKTPCACSIYSPFMIPEPNFMADWPAPIFFL